MPFPGQRIAVDALSPPVITRGELAAELRISLATADGSQLDRLIADSQSFVEQASRTLLVSREVTETIDIHPWTFSLMTTYRRIASIRQIQWAAPDDDDPSTVDSDIYAFTSSGRIWAPNKDWPWRDADSGTVTTVAGDWQAQVIYTAGIADSAAALGSSPDGLRLRRDMLALAATLYEDPMLSLGRAAESAGISARGVGGAYIA